MAPNQSGPTSIGLTSGRVIPLKNLPYSCKYSTGETLKCIAVVLTVKVSYVASTKYKKLETKVQQLPYIFNIPKLTHEHISITSIGQFS